MYEINETHDPNLKSWVESANDPNTDFPIQNLPFCTYKNRFGANHNELGVRIGDRVIEFEVLTSGQLLKNLKSYPQIYIEDISQGATETRDQLRRILVNALSEGANSSSKAEIEASLVAANECEFVQPFSQIRDYTDFYCSIYHATNVGSMFRPDNPLMPNYKYIPIGYHGRASSIVVSGTDIKRPKGQNRSDADAPPVFIPAKNLDYEMELGFFVGKGNELGTSIPISEAEEHIFGLCLVNDWSARDIQAWEYQPLGPFLAKSFATTISPFVVTMEALAPFRVPAFERDPDDPQPLDYLNDEQNQKFGGLDIKLEVYLQTEKMRQENIEPHMLSRSNPKDLYWTIGQMLTHHASNGCNLQTGDLMASGTVSGKEKHERGCLLELTWRGTEPLDLPSGEQRRFLEDGDEIIMKGYCEREGFRRIGFGECRGKVLSAE
ncbi:MAG TPA: fumarylacetoacetase [Pyrinomonadaceae bacterium]|nr:fumarylacetoacetase [Pyrinomonadaceae bacterium]HMP65801.1 fumarylacetoacetase [Pyrinomonadaceae bacterium]